MIWYYANFVGKCVRAFLCAFMWVFLSLRIPIGVYVCA